MKKGIFGIIAILSAMLVAILLTGCGSRSAGSGTEEFTATVYAPEYASGFSIKGRPGGTSTLLESTTPWQGADSTSATTLLIVRDCEEVPDGYKGQVLRGDARRIVCMSSSYIAMLDAVGAADRVVGVSGIDFVSNSTVQARRDSVGDVGYDGNIDYELLLTLRPDVVLLYGVGASSAMEGKLRELGISYAYIGEYAEESPLGKAEWLVAVAEVAGLRENGIEVFRSIPERYNAYRMLASEATTRPRVMINTPYGDQWVMAPADSYVARLIDDASGEYVYTKNNTGRSVPIDMEEAYLLTDGADCWINTGRYTTIADLTGAFPKFAATHPVSNGQVFNSSRRTTAAGGNDYWESGVVNPDIVLRDLVKIFHPELLPDTEFVYYEQLK